MNGKAKADARRCRWCGAELAGEHGRPAEACPSCAAVRKAAYQKLRRAHGRAPSAAALDEATAAAVAAGARPRPPVRTARCLFCGHLRRVDARGYCSWCVRNGFDRVHEETGRTNDWDRPPRRAARAADGWRGRPMTGRASWAERAEFWQPRP